jgi:inorganic triphosphatase YgiF
MALEIETKLVVLGDDREALLEGLARRTALGPYRLAPAGIEMFRDTYYDSPGCLLSGQRIALRTRETERSVVFCIKHSERVKDSGVAEREELETPWSPQCLDQAARILRRAPMEALYTPPGFEDPLHGLARLGLAPIQSRQTRRQALDVRDAEGKILAELALDEVCYHVAGGTVLHCEIEAEAKGCGDVSLIEHVTGLVSRLYPDRLIRWDYNKLITGLALERLMGEGRLPAPSGKILLLDRSGYTAIDAFISGSQGVVRPQQ